MGCFEGKHPLYSRCLNCLTVPSRVNKIKNNCAIINNFYNYYAKMFKIKKHDYKVEVDSLCWHWFNRVWLKVKSLLWAELPPWWGGWGGAAWVWVWRMPCQVGWQVFALPLFPFEPHWWKELGLPSVWMHWEVQLIIFWWSWGNEDTPWQITMTNPMSSKSSAKMAFGKIRACWLEGHWTNTLALWRVYSHGESLSWTFPEV